MKKSLSIVLLFINILLLAQQNEYVIIPNPVEINYSQEVFTLSQNTKIITKNLTEFETNYFIDALSLQTGITLKTSKSSKNSIKFLALQTNSNPKDYYEIAISQESIVISYTSTASKMYALQSVLQMLPYQRQNEIRLQGVNIKDYPKFQWRGMHLDVARHFFPVEFIKKYIDFLVLYKFNTFHFHLTDDQGWRIEIKKFPKLTEIGSLRSGTMVGHYTDQAYDNIPYQGFYTQEQIQEIVSYAKARNITVIPEIEMPGHSMAALAAYPQYSCTGSPVDVAKGWGVFDDVFCPKEETFEFIEAILSEVITLFDSEYIHIGGDECPKVRWKSCEHCQTLIKKENLKDEHELQSYFIKRIDSFLTQKGKKLIGWDEILEGGISPNATIMSWRGESGAIEAANSNHYAIMSPGSHCYFDYYQGNPENEPLAIGGYTTLEKVYNFNPIPKELEEDKKQYIIGGQANVWTEYITSAQQVEYMIFPRFVALSEVLWGTSNPLKYDQFAKRLTKHFFLYEAKNITYSKAMFDVSLSTEIQQNKLYLVLDSYDKSGIKYSINSELNANAESYKVPILVDKDITIQAAYYKGNKQLTKTISQAISISKSTAQNITLINQPHANYAFGGKNALIDGIKGNPKRHGKNWLGFWGKNVDATINFSQNQSINTVKMSFLESEGSWIYFPEKIQIFIKQNNQYQLLKELSKEYIQQVNGLVQVDFPTIITDTVHIIAICNPKINTGKPGAGSPAWLFIDEIYIE